MMAFLSNRFYSLRFSILLSLTLIAAGNSFCQGAGFTSELKSSDLPAIISQNTRLSMQYSPYLAARDVTVNSGISLTVDPGVTILFYRNAGLYVKGDIQILGTVNEPVTLNAAPGQDKWEVLSIFENTATCTIRHAKFRNCTTGDNANHDRAAISASKSRKIILDHVDIREVSSCIYYNTPYEECEFRSCYFESEESGSIMFLVKTDMIIDRCEFKGNNGENSDAIDFDKVNGTISNCHIHSMTGPASDGIDMGSDSRVTLTNNLIENCTDSGIEAEEKTVVTGSRNIIRNCAIGMTVKEEASATMINNTFDRCLTAFSLYSETDTWNHGGTMIGINNIIYRSNQVFRLRNNSSITLRYNLCSSQRLDGTGNIMGDPLFVSAAGGNYNLLAGSPAIDAGDPAQPLDPDGTRSDIGAIPFTQEQEEIQLYINEVVSRFGTLHADEKGVFNDWIEIYNPNNFEVNLAGWYLSDRANQLSLHQISGSNPILTTIPAKGFLIFWADADPGSGPLHVDFQLSSGGEDVYLSRMMGGSMQIVDHLAFPALPTDVSYGRYPDGQDELTTFMFPTPRRPNDFSSILGIKGLYINEFMARYDESYPDEHGLHSDWIELYNSNNYPVNIGGLYITDDRTKPDRHRIMPFHTDSTIIQPKGFMILRPDLLTRLGFNHLDFELAGAGEDLFLFQRTADEYRIIDSIHYPSQTYGISYGRYGDGNPVWRYFENPTPNRSNGPASFSPEILHYSSSVRIFPNPFKDRVMVTVQTKSPDPIQISLFDLTGKKLSHHQFNPLEYDYVIGTYSKEFVFSSMDLPFPQLVIIEITTPAERFSFKAMQND